jgi:outer membrane protein
MKVKVAIRMLTLLGVCLTACGTRGEEAARALSLEAALAITLARNPDVAEAQSRLAEAEAGLRTARAGGLPTLKARGTADHWTDDQRLAPAARNGETGVFGSDMLGAELVAALPLYTGGRVSGATDAADWSRKAALDQAVRVREELAYQVTAVFYGLLAQDEVLRSLETAVRAMDEQQRTIRELVAAEKAARVDLLRANVRHAELYERQLRERNNRTVQQRAWAALLGLDDVAAPEAQGELTLRAPPECPASTECMRIALARRADYRAAQATVSAADASVRAARAGYRPTLSAQASYGVRWMPDSSLGSDGQHDVGRIGLVAEFPLFDGYLTDAAVAAQAASQRGAHARLRKLELQIRFEVETAVSEIAAARERVQTAEQSVGQAEESFRIMKEKYDLGKGTMTDVLDAQTALVTAETSYARALADLAIADARRKLATGEGVP